ncbi:MAG: hypothetical protein AB9869_24545 [Verrucomicrobiia bacterium]
MKATLLYLAALLAGALLQLGCATTNKDALAWEYRVIDGYVRNPNAKPDQLLQSRLDAAANDGWTVVSSSSGDTVPSDYPYAIVILKRPRR